MNNINIVWTAVVSAVTGLGCVISAFAGDTDFVLAFGLTSISMALLSGREV